MIIEGKHELQIRCKKQRALAVKHGAFHESAFRYLGESLLIWDLKKYLENPKLKDDAIRKSRRYVESQLYTKVHPKTFKKRKQFGMETPKNESRRKRFRRIIEHLYKKSLE